MMLASIVLPRPTSSARIARPPICRSTRWATSIWWGSSLIALASRVISRSKPGTSAIRSASRRRSYQARSAGGARSCAANAASELSSTDQASTDQASSSGGRDEGGEGEGDGRDGVARLGIVAQRWVRAAIWDPSPPGMLRCVTRDGLFGLRRLVLHCDVALTRDLVDQLVRHRVGHDAEVMVGAIIHEVTHARCVQTGELVHLPAEQALAAPLLEHGSPGRIPMPGYELLQGGGALPQRPVLEPQIVEEPTRPRFHLAGHGDAVSRESRAQRSE